MAAKWVLGLKLALEFVPAVIKAVRAVEEALPEGGRGAEKLALVRGILEAVYGQMKDASERFEEVWPILKEVIDRVVGFLNAAGVFKKKVA